MAQIKSLKTKRNNGFLIKHEFSKGTAETDKSIYDKMTVYNQTEEPKVYFIRQTPKTYTAREEILRKPDEQFDSKEKVPDSLLITELNENINIQETELPDNIAELTNEELLLQKKEFEKEAIPHMKILHYQALKMTGNESEAEDLVQDTYLRAFRFFYKYERDTNCRAWLLRIMKNLFINNYKKMKQQPNIVNYEDVENFYETIKSDRLDSGDLQENVFASLLDDELTIALNSLQDDYKTVIILCDIEGLTYEEIADFVKCPVGTIRSRLHRARKLLQEKLSSYAKNKGYLAEQDYKN